MYLYYTYGQFPALDASDLMEFLVTPYCFYAFYVRTTNFNFQHYWFFYNVSNVTLLPVINIHREIVHASSM
jgi:hypothetical protein